MTTNSLTQVRTDLQAAVESAGLTVHTIVPERYVPPAVVIEGDEPYISFEGASYGAFLVHHRLIVIAAVGINERTAEELDRMVLLVLGALPERHLVEDVGRPGSWAVNLQAHPAVVVHVATEITPEEPA